MASGATPMAANSASQVLDCVLLTGSYLEHQGACHGPRSMIVLHEVHGGDYQPYPCVLTPCSPGKAQMQGSRSPCSSNPIGQVNALPWRVIGSVNVQMRQIGRTGDGGIRANVHSCRFDDTGRSLSEQRHGDRLNCAERLGRDVAQVKPPGVGLPTSRSLKTSPIGSKFRTMAGDALMSI